MLETPARIEPCGLEEAVPEALSDLVVKISVEAEALGLGLHEDTVAELRAVMRITNSYFSNLIEGHRVNPCDIERAVEGCFDEVENSVLAQEAAALIEAQSWVDEVVAHGTVPTSAAFIREIHRRFFETLHPDLRVAEHGSLRREIVPGQFRVEGHEVSVGLHIPPSAHRVEAFMAHFERRYFGLTRGARGRVLSIPAAHHRLNFIHPFDDGNGRVSRLMSHAMCQAAGISGRGLWSISRGLARGLNDPLEYKQRMEAADQPRRGDRDGRGNLSLAMLESFTGWFLGVIHEQLLFTKDLFNSASLCERYIALVCEIFPDQNGLPNLVSHVFHHGEMAIEDACQMLGASHLPALLELSDRGFLKQASATCPIRLAFPIEHHQTLFPKLFQLSDSV
ncbi:Fic family protein [Donghicola mangrovi]|uniref:Fic family protein n=1 Tax=Donghicola mangrovi TaxID=2729614 RepID=A0A850Q8K1_9RHOB|nr:Fic family protein [Donghicola mangrovi]NVO23308.1 Fic family protein [Donghicola mangrovi]